MRDLKNGSIGMRVVPITPEEFKMLKTGPFVAFLASFGIRKSQSNPIGKG